MSRPDPHLDLGEDPSPSATAAAGAVVPPEDSAASLASTAKAAGAGVGGVSVLYALDVLLRNSDAGSVPQVLAQAGPVLGVLYANAPVTLAIALIALWWRQESRREQREQRARARKLQAAVRSTTQAVEDLRGDVRHLDGRLLSLDGRLGDVQAAQAATDARLDEQGAEIRGVRERVDQHETLLRRSTPPRPGGPPASKARRPEPDQAPRGRRRPS